MKELYEKPKVIDIDEDELVELYAMEGDTARCINFKFINAVNIIDLTGCKVRINAINSKLNPIYNDLTILDAKRGIAQLKLTTALLQPGVTEYQLQITGPQGELKPKIMRLNVAPRLNNDDAIEGSDEFTALKNAMNEVDKYNKEFADKSGKLETLYTERLNGIDSQLSENEKFNALNANALSPIITPTPDGSGQTVHPKVLYFENGWGKNGYEYWMACTPYKNTNDDLENPCILASRNGYEFFVPEGLTNPIDKPSDEDLRSGAHMSDTHIVMVDGVMELWYRYNPGNGNGWVDNSRSIIYRRKSSDGVAWSEREVIFDGTNQRLSPTILYENGKYRLWYVNDYNIYYTESDDNCRSWKEDVKCHHNFGEWKYNPWHIDVIKTDLGYELVASCTKGKNIQSGVLYLFHGVSQDCKLFENIKMILSPSPDKYAFDNKCIYRSTILKIGNKYKIYYSANQMDGTWWTALTEGSSITNLQGSNFNTLWYNMIALKNLEIKEKLITGLISYLTNSELKLGVKDVASVLLTCDEIDNRLKVLSSNKEYGGDVDLRKLYAKEVRVATTSSTDSMVNGNGLVFSDDPTEYKRNLIKLVNKGVAGAKITVQELSDTVRILADNGTQGGMLQCSGIYFDVSNGKTQAIKGAIRFNNDTNKHQGYDGTRWNDLY